MSKMSDRPARIRKPPGTEVPEDFSGKISSFLKNTKMTMDFGMRQS